MQIAMKKISFLDLKTKKKKKKKKKEENSIDEGLTHFLIDLLLNTVMVLSKLPLEAD